jgi:ubiquinone/menaquinone biosynthesis C-methylase UbiE
MSVAASYDARAASYDDKTTFHKHLASEYVEYAKPQTGESLLDLACGTGLVTFLFAPILQSTSSQQKPKVVGVDISPGMLSVARSKLLEKKNEGVEIEFVEHDITSLDEAEILGRMEGSFDIITICSALVLLKDPGKAIKHWSKWLKRGGRMIVDIPFTHSMLSLKIFDIISPEFGIEVLGKRTWIKGPKSLQTVMEDAGLETEVLATDVFDDIPARTEQGRSEWGTEEGEGLF